MDNKVIFAVLCNVRFNVMGVVKLPTPIEFAEFSEAEKNELFDRMYDAWRESCEALVALMTIEKNYQQLESR